MHRRQRGRRWTQALSRSPPAHRARYRRGHRGRDLRRHRDRDLGRLRPRGRRSGDRRLDPPRRGNQRIRGDHLLRIRGDDPISGSAYTYAYATLGELVAWIIGWDLILEYAVGNIAVAIGWAGYFDSLL